MDRTRSTGIGYPAPQLILSFAESNQLLNFKHVINLYPQKINGFICHAILEDDQTLREQLVEIIRQNPGVDLVSYATTSEFIDLVAWLRKQGLEFDTPEAPNASHQWVSSFVDSKTGFRQTWVQLAEKLPPLPAGAICQKPSEL